MDTSDKIKEIIGSQLAVEPENIADTTTFEDLGVDSLDKIEITLQLEESFQIEIPDSDTEKLLTIGDVVKYIEAKLNK